MADEQTPDETTEGTEATPTGPVEGEDTSSSQAAGEAPAPTPPVDEASEDAPGSLEPSEVEASTDESAEVSDEPVAEEADEAPTADAAEEGTDDAPAEEAAAVEETPAGEAPAAEEAPAEEPAAEKPAAEKKDVIPGADLEPIAIDSEAPALSAEEQARLEAEEEEKARREAELAAAQEADAAVDRAPAKMESGARFLATGKRKRSIARVTLLPGEGQIVVNGRSLEEFFPRPLHQTMARQPLAVSGYEGNVDVRVRVHGGGISGQAGAVRHGIARALTEIDPELRGDLKRRGFLTRDARVKERRKAGLKKARKRPQFSKR
jgi:small subunit ribosomal protein S9